MKWGRGKALRNSTGATTMTTVIVLMAASVAAVVPLYDYIQSVGTQRATLDYQTQIRLALRSVLNYSAYMVKQRVCVDNTFIRATCDDPMSANNLERLLLTKGAAAYLATSLNEANHSHFTPEDVMLSSFEKTIDLAKLTELHPLYQILSRLKNTSVLNYVHITIKRDTGFVSKGREVYLRFMVDARKSETSMLSISGFQSEMLIGFIPRELNSFALVTSGNLNLSGQSVPGKMKTNTDTDFPVTAVKIGEGLNFQSPVFLNKSVILANSSPAQPLYANITFNDFVVFGEGEVYQVTQAGVVPFSPASAGGTQDSYNYQNTRVFGGFQRGMKMELKDSGLDCMLNGDKCSADSSTMNKCIKLTQKRSDLSYTEDATFVLRKIAGTQSSSTSSSKTQTSFYQVGVSHEDEFIPAVGVSMTRNPGEDTCYPQGSVSNAKNPCWKITSSQTGESLAPGSDDRSGIYEPTFLATSPPRVTGSGGSSLENSHPTLNTLIKLHFPKQDIQLQADIAPSSVLSFDLNFASQSAVDALNTQHTNDVNDTTAKLSRVNSQISCLENPPPAPTPTPSETLPFPTETPSGGPSESPTPSPSVSESPSPTPTPTADPCTTTFNCTSNKCDERSLGNLKGDKSNLEAALETLNSVDLSGVSANAGKNVHFELELTPVPNTSSEMGLTMKIDNANLLPAPPSISFFSYELGTSTTGQNLRSGSNKGPNGKSRTIQYEWSSSLNRLVERPTASGGSFPVSTDPTGWRWTTGAEFANPDNAPLDPDDGSRSEVESKCKEVVNTQGNSAWDVNFDTSAFTSWNFYPKHTSIAAKNAVIIDSANEKTWQIWSVVDNCVIDASATVALGFMTCRNLYIDYGAKTSPEGAVTVGNPQTTRSVPLEIIGTFIVGKLHISPTALARKITWRNIYHPLSIQTLKDKGVLWGANPADCKVSPTSPVWLPNPKPDQVERLYRCTPMYLRDMANPFQWTSISPNCGLPDGGAVTVCGSQMRSRNFMTFDLFRSSEKGLSAGDLLKLRGALGGAGE